MEQISEPNKMYKIANDRGIASEKLMEFCTFQIHEDYQEEMQSSLTCQHWGTVKEKNFVSQEYRISRESGDVHYLSRRRKFRQNP